MENEIHEEDYNYFLTEFKPIYQHNLDNNQHQFNSFYHLVWWTKDYKLELRRAAFSMVTTLYRKKEVDTFIALYKRVLRKMEVVRLHKEADLKEYADKAREASLNNSALWSSVLKKEQQAAGDKVCKGKRSRRKEAHPDQLAI